MRKLRHGEVECLCEVPGVMEAAISHRELVSHIASATWLLSFEHLLAYLFLPVELAEHLSILVINLVMLNLA